MNAAGETPNLALSARRTLPRDDPSGAGRHFVAEVSVDLMEAEGGWSPYLTLGDAYRLDDIRDALRRGDIRTALRMARVYKLTPVEIHRDAS